MIWRITISVRVLMFTRARLMCRQTLLIETSASFSKLQRLSYRCGEA